MKAALEEAVYDDGEITLNGHATHARSCQVASSRHYCAAEADAEHSMGG